MLWTLTLVAALLSADAAIVHDPSAIAFLRTLQTPSGGFIDVPSPKGTPPQPSLRLTRTALRSFRLLGGQPANREAVSRYLKACYDPQSGGFADHPGAKPDPISTAVGLMIFGELKLSAQPYVERGLKFMNDKTEGFEQIRMVASALEELNRSVPQARQWLKAIDRARNPDGSYGSGPGKARTTALYVMTQTRLGGKPESRQAVLRILRDGQRDDGGFGGPAPGGSDLEACYRIVRVIAYFHAQPLHPEKLQAFIARCRNRDGGYGERPHRPSSLHGTYYATIVRHWLAAPSERGATGCDQRSKPASSRAKYDGGYEWVEGVLKHVGPYTWIREVAERMKKSELTAFDPRSFVAWIQREFKKSQPAAIAGKRDVLFKALNVAAAMSADTRFEPLVRYWLDTTVAAAERLKTPARPGVLTIHKLYNEGVILRTRNVCLGIDLYFPSRTPASVVRTFADRLDGLLVTHSHGDHRQENLIELLRRMGKPVVIAADDPAVPLGGKLDSGSIRAARWTSFRGSHLDPTFSGFFSVTIAGWHMLHSGDNTVWPPAFLKSEYADHVNVFFVKLEREAPAAVARMGPRFFVPQHLLELGHGMNAYGHDALALRHRRQNADGPRLLMLQWGDSYEIADPRQPERDSAPIRR